MNRALVATALMIAVLLPSPAGAVDAVESGWWWREQPADGTLPPPPQVPDGGLRVAADPSGQSAVAAVRIPLSTGDRNAVLTLKVAAGTLQGVVLNACPAKGDWKPVSAGAWSSRPAPDCSAGGVAGSPSADGTTVSFDLSSVVPSAASGALDVVLFTSTQPLPVDPSPLPVPREMSSTADVSFAKPTPGDVTVTNDGTGDTSDAVPVPDSALFGDAGALSYDTLPLLDIAPPPAPAPAPTPSRTSAPRTGTPLNQFAAPTLRPVARAFDDVAEKRDRLLAAFVFIDLMLAWWYLERRRSVGVVDDAARPRISLHDDPALVVAAHAARHARRSAATVAVDAPPLR